MKKLLSLLTALFLLLGSAACAETTTAVVCYSRADENYSVGYIEKGNTQILAELIAEKTGADLYMIDVAEPFPAAYDECIAVVHQEMADGIERALAGDVDISAYDTVYIGYPIWWGSVAMPMQTFLKSHDWSGKTVIPFNTHEGRGQSGTVSMIRELCAGAEVLDGIAIRGSVAQNETEQAEALLDEWLAGMAEDGQ